MRAAEPPDPDHAVLHRECVEVLQRTELVATWSSRDCKSSSQFVPPCLGKPRFDRGVSKCFEFRCRSTHVSRTTEDDRVACCECSDDLIVFVTAADDVVTADGD